MLCEAHATWERIFLDGRVEFTCHDCREDVQISWDPAEYGYDLLTWQRVTFALYGEPPRCAECRTRGPT